MLLTIYTPTYNREKLLPRLYESLCKQIRTEFIWLVIDDGSSDGTKSLVESWQNNSAFQIKYVYKENGGVHTARDVAYKIVDTELVWGVDSDDWLAPNAVENVIDLWEKKGSDEVCGIFAPVRDVSKKMKEIVYPSGDRVSYQDLFFKHRAKGDQTIVLSSKVIKKIPEYPKYEDEKLVSESYKWIQLPNKPFLILRNFTTFVEYQADGFTQNVRYGYFKNLKGYCDLYNVCMKYSLYYSKKFQFAIKYVIASLFLGKKDVIRYSKSPVLAFLVYPVGFLFFLVLEKRWSKYRLK